jgi:hypothetical protein
MARKCHISFPGFSALSAFFGVFLGNAFEWQRLVHGE